MQASELLRELKRTVDELQAFNEIGRTLTSTLEVREVLRIIMQKVSALLQPGNWSLLLIDDKLGDLYFEIAVGEGAEKLKPMRLAMGEGIAGWVAREGQPILVEDVQRDRRFVARFDEATGRATHSVVAVPLRSKGTVLGVIELVNPAGTRPFTPDDLRTLSTLADYAAIGIENAKAFERIQELTLIDDHTGLGNHRQLLRSLEAEAARAQRFGRNFSVIFLDLDHFKAVNDTHGHQAGSALLKELGAVLLKTLRSVDVTTRYGGDEFVILLPESNREQAMLVAERIRQAIHETTFLTARGLEIHITASFGVATFPDDGIKPEDLLMRADSAMYRVKGGNRNGVAAAVPVAMGEEASPPPRP
jgi:diguanylate cyclase (GGDEF)-like protein